MVKTTVYLEPEIALALRQISQREGRSQADLIRTALAEYARARKRPPIPGLGAFDSGRTDGSTRAEEILRRASRDGKWRKQGSRGPHR